MATLVLGTVGTLVGGPIGGAIGAVVGQSLDAALFAPKPREGARLSELAVQVSTYGAAIPKLFGTMRVAGSVIWSTDLNERRATTGGGKGRPRQVDYSYSASFAVALSGRPILSVKRIWADGKLLRGAAGDFKAATQFRVHKGDEDQAADPLIVAAEGAGQAPAFRGIAYAMFEDFALADYGNRIPSLTFEVEADGGPVTVAEVAAALSEGAIAAGAAPVLAGFAATGTSLRSAVEALADFAGLSLRDDNSGMVLGRASGPAVLLGGETARREITRRAAASIPAEVSLAYHDVARDYQAGLQRARAEGAPGEGRIERQAAPAALSAGAAKALAEQRLASLWAERAQARVGLGWRWAALRPGTLVALEGEAGQWRIARKVIGPMSGGGNRRAGGAGGAGPGGERAGPAARADNRAPAGPAAWRGGGSAIRGGRGDRDRSRVAAGGAVAQPGPGRELDRYRRHRGSCRDGSWGDGAGGRRCGFDRRSGRGRGRAAPRRDGVAVVRR
jgi:hypothetical protein